jgi:hypothetical protein
MRSIILVVGLLLSGLAFAQQDYPRDLTLSWTNASTYEPLSGQTVGAPIEPGDLTGVRIECFRQNDSVALFTATIPAEGEGLPQSALFAGVIPQPGTYVCYGYSIVISGAESVASNAATKKFTGKPTAPATFRFN